MLRTSTINTWEVIRDCLSRRGCGSIRAIFTICLWTSDISIPQKLFRNAEPQVLPQTVSNFLDDAYTHESVGSVTFENSLLSSENSTCYDHLAIHYFLMEMEFNSKY